MGIGHRMGNPSLVSLSNGPIVLFSIWSRAGAYNQTELAADIGPRILRFYEEYFNTSFPLPKQDMIAIPGKADVIQVIFLYGRLTIKVPIANMTREVMILIRANTLQWPLEGVGPKNQDFFGPEKWRFFSAC